MPPRVMMARFDIPAALIKSQHELRVRFWRTPLSDATQYRGVVVCL